jgi:hypothetical protein
MSGIIAQNTLDNSGLIKAPAGGGAWNFISKQTASGDSDISFTSGIDSTYKEYVFTFINIHPSVDEPKFTFQVDTGTNTNYNQQITSTQFQDYHTESGSYTGLGYAAGDDQANGTAFQSLIQNVEADNDNCTSGFLYLFNPSSSTFVKHFMGRFYTQQSSGGEVYANGMFPAGYINTTTAITRVQFKMSSGNIDAGDFCLYGLTT